MRTAMRLSKLLIIEITIIAIILSVFACIFAESVSAASGRWIPTGDGWMYEDEGGRHPKSQWSKINDKWYYFDSNGIMKRGWQNISGAWYYLGSPNNPDLGAMATGWRQMDGKWYYFGTNGVMKRGWQKIDGVWYYFGNVDNAASGAMATGWRQIEGKWYYFGTNGVMKRGWQKIDGKWYYFGSSSNLDSGAMLHGWARINERWYYFGSPKSTGTGYMRHGWLEVEGIWYYLGHPDNPDTGAMVTGIVNTSKYDEESKYYYFADNGVWQSEYSGIHYGLGKNHGYYFVNGIWKKETLLYKDLSGTYYYIQDGIIEHAEGDISNLGSNTGVLVSIDDQHIWFYKNGALIISSPIVSGTLGVSETPKGTFKIYNKTRNTRLTGPTWNVFVNYWMPIDAYGWYGIHDSSWRDSYGGNIYTYDGSHGCVNVPVEAVGVIFSNIDLYTLVKIY